MKKNYLFYTFYNKVLIPLEFNKLNLKNINAMKRSKNVTIKVPIYFITKNLISSNNSVDNIFGWNLFSMFLLYILTNQKSYINISKIQNSLKFKYNYIELTVRGNRALHLLYLIYKNTNTFTVPIKHKNDLTIILIEDLFHLYKNSNYFGFLQTKFPVIIEIPSNQYISSNVS